MSLIAPQWLEPHLGVWNEFARTTQLVDWSAWGTLLVVATLSMAIRQAGEGARRDAVRSAMLTSAFAGWARAMALNVRLHTDRDPSSARISIAQIRDQARRVRDLMADYPLGHLPSGASIQAAAMSRMVVLTLFDTAEYIVAQLGPTPTRSSAAKTKGDQETWAAGVAALNRMADTLLGLSQTMEDEAAKLTQAGSWEKFRRLFIPRPANIRRGGAS